MSVFLVVRLHARPERLADVLTRLQHELHQTPAKGQSRRRSRFFRRLQCPTDLLGLSEWTHQTAFDAYLASFTHAAIVENLEGPPRVTYCTRLSSFERVLQRSEVTVCMLIDGSDPAAAVPIETYLAGAGREETLAAPGLVSFEIYRVLGQPATSIVVQNWRKLTDLEHFRLEIGAHHEQTLTSLGARIERFTGHLTAEYPTP